MTLPIKSITTYPVRIPLKTPIYLSSRAIEFTDNLIVKIETENGYVGWGEAASAFRMTGDVLPGMDYVVRSILSPLLIGKDALNYVDLLKRVQASLYKNTGPKCAIEIALLDLVSKYLGIPLYQLLGDAQRTKFNPILILGGKDFNEDIAKALEYQQSGSDFFKIKIGVSSVEQEIDNLKKLRLALGHDARICADGNMGMDLASARQFLSQAKEFDLTFVEEPIRTPGKKHLSQLDTSLCADEQIQDIDDIEEYAPYIDGVNLKTIKLGGIINTLAAASKAHALGLRINLAQKISETSIAARAMLHLAALVPNIDWGMSLTNEYLLDDPVDNPLSRTNGVYVLDDSPGIGVQVDEDKINQYPFIFS